MKSCGIICEYNPFHYGHAYHIEKAKELSQCDVIICVMSSHFVQRGEPAILNKWKRAECALQHGADIVFELPYIASTQSAAYFAKNAMQLMKLAKVNSICFGSETNDLTALKQMSNKLSDIMLTPSLSPVSAYESLLGKMSPNDILAINYLAYCDDIEAITIQRTNDYHSIELDKQIASATAIRKAVLNHHGVQFYTPMEFDHAISLEAYYPLIQYQLMIHTAEELKDIFLIDEGIENLFLKNKDKTDLESFIQACISKRYTRSKIQRTLIQLLTHTTKKKVNTLPELNYLRPLAMNKKGQQYLKEKDLPIAACFSQIPVVYRDMEMKATEVYASVFDEPYRSQLKKMELQPPVIWD